MFSERTRYYNQDGTSTDLQGFIDNIEKRDRIIKQDNLKNGLFISTVFLCLDHNWDFSEEAKPLIFETMVFNNGKDLYQDRYSTKEEALEGHANAIKMYQSKWRLWVLWDRFFKL